jgi:ABC-2 type transport system permease protein
MMYVEKDDFRQVTIIAKNEVRKFIRGKKFLIYLVLIIAVFALITFLPYLLGGSLGDTPGRVISIYISFATFLAVLAAALFASVVYVSEFEERTALILFTRPVKKTTIFIGKFLGCIALELVAIIGYYAAAGVATLAMTGGFPDIFGMSMGYMILYTFAATGVASVFSTMMRKAGTATVMTFLTLLLFITIISQIVAVATDIDPWFMLDEAANAILTCIPEYIDMVSGTMQNVQAPDAVKTVGTMLGWGIASTVLSWILFTRKEF